MKTDNEILTQFNKDLSRFQSSYERQRFEIAQCYEMKAGHQFTGEEHDTRKHLDKPIITVNVAASYIDAIAGSDVVNGKRIEYIPASAAYDKEIDLMNDAAKYIEDVADLHSERLIAMKDTLTCGLGAYVNHLDYSAKQAVAGLPKATRIFPGFTFYDNSVRGARINTDAKFMGYADPVDSDSLTDYIKEKLGNKQDVPTGQTGTTDLWFLTYLRSDNIANLDFMYYYYWWDFEPLYDVANPFVEGTTLFKVINENEDAANIIGILFDELRIDQMQPYFCLNGDEYKRFKDALEALEAITGVEVEDLEVGERKGKCFYKAEIARGQVLTKSKTFTQNGFPMVFIVGNYDEILGTYYGLMRPLFDLQRALNIAYSDLLGYIEDAVTGGGAYVKGSIDNIKKLEQSKANAKKLTYITQDMDIISKSKADTLQSLTSFIQVTLDLFPKVLGTPPEFMGTLSTKDMGSNLYAQVIKQSTLALSSFANNSDGSIKRQADINVDFAKLLARQIDAYPIHIISPNSANDKTIEFLTKDRLADQYKYRIAERPLTPNEKRETFQMLMEYAPTLQQAGVNMTAATAAIMEFAPFEYETKQKFIEAATPQPPQPDPLNQALLQSQVDLQSAQAAKLFSDAEAQKQRVATEAAQSQMDVVKTASEIDLNQAKEKEIMAKIGEMVNSRLDAIEQLILQRL